MTEHDFGPELTGRETVAVPNNPEGWRKALIEWLRSGQPPRLGILGDGQNFKIIHIFDSEVGLEHVTRIYGVEEGKTGIIFDRIVPEDEAGRLKETEFLRKRRKLGHPRV